MSLEVRLWFPYGGPPVSSSTIIPMKYFPHILTVLVLIAIILGFGYQPT